MKVLGTNVIVLKHKPEYNGLLEGIASEESTYAKVLGIGSEVSTVALGDTLLLDWNKSKKIKNDLYAIDIADVVCVMDEEDLV